MDKTDCSSTEAEALRAMARYTKEKAEAEAKTVHRDELIKRLRLIRLNAEQALASLEADEGFYHDGSERYWVMMGGRGNGDLGTFLSAHRDLREAEGAFESTRNLLEGTAQAHLVDTWSARVLAYRPAKAVAQ